MTAALTVPASPSVGWAWRVAAAIEALGPAVRSAPAPIKYSSMPLSWHGRVPTGWRTARRHGKGFPGLCGRLERVGGRDSQRDDQREKQAEHVVLLRSRPDGPVYSSDPATPFCYRNVIVHHRQSV